MIMVVGMAGPSMIMYQCPGFTSDKCSLPCRNTIYSCFKCSITLWYSTARFGTWSRQSGREWNQKLNGLACLCFRFSLIVSWEKPLWRMGTFIGCATGHRTAMRGRILSIAYPYRHLAIQKQSEKSREYVMMADIQPVCAHCFEMIRPSLHLYCYDTVRVCNANTNSACLCLSVTNYDCRKYLYTL
jgi:hypothetical protein